MCISQSERSEIYTTGTSLEWIQVDSSISIGHLQLLIIGESDIGRFQIVDYGKESSCNGRRNAPPPLHRKWELQIGQDSLDGTLLQSVSSLAYIVSIVLLKGGAHLEHEVTDDKR